MKIGSINRIVHLADIHIRLYKRADEYRQVFNTLDRQLSKLNLTERDLIVVAGDVIHTKIELSPEMIELTSTFFKMLTKHATTLLIAGNHDFNMNNRDRLDSLTPIVDSLKLPNLHYWKRSGIYPVGNVEFGVYSLFDDPSLWPTIDDYKASTKIGLFHGPVYSAETDVGFTITSRHHTLDMFDGLDAVLLGDIHKHQVLQSYDRKAKKPIVAYASSLVQQNHGESLKGHGFCLWDVPSRSFEFHEVENDYGYYTIRVEGKDIPAITDVPKNVRLRLFSGDLDETEIKKLLSTLQTKYNIVEKSITRSSLSRFGKHSANAINFLDIHDINYQNKLITEYVRNHHPNTSEEVVGQILEINKDLNGELAAEDFARKIVWVPKRLKFDNLFTYGEGNDIDFSSLNGIIGIFAPNASGKSSIPDAICFALYDRTPRASKGAHIMNTRKDDCYCEFIFAIGDVEYGIVRRGKRGKKNEVKIDVDFWRVEADGNKTSLNGEERRLTNEVIRQYVGDFDDFLLTAFSAQDKNSLFIDRGQSDRKDVLNQFMGLKILDDLHRLAKDRSKEVAGQLKQFKSDDFTEDLAVNQTLITSFTSELQDAALQLTHHTESIEAVDVTLQQLYEQKRPVTVAATSVDILLEKKASIETRVASVQQTIDSLRTQFDAGPVFDGVTDAIDAKVVDYEEKIARGVIAVQENTEWVEVQTPIVQQLKLQREVASAELTKLKSSLTVVEMEIRKHRSNIKLLDTVELNPNCDACAKNIIMIDAMKSRTEIAVAESRHAEIQQNIASVMETMAELETVPDQVRELDERIKKLAAQELALEKLRTSLADLAAQRERALADVEKKHQAIKEQIAQHELQQKKLDLDWEKAAQDIEEFWNQKDAIDHNARISEQIVDAKEQRAQVIAERDGMEKLVRRIEADLAVARSRRDALIDKIRKAEEMEALYEAYDVYLSTMSRDGLPYQMVADVIPMVEGEVNSILEQMVDFTVSLEQDGKNINGWISYADDRKWPLELASGMEKFISGLAIRIALMGVSSLPKSNFLIIDEGFGTLDAENRGSLNMLFTLLRNSFDFILIISHLDTMRDITDQIVDISRQDSFSKIIAT